jgi:hypothetical protein
MYVDVVVNLLLAVIAFAAMSRLNAATGWEYIGPILVIAQQCNPSLARGLQSKSTGRSCNAYA